jgi:hypothetical protein
MPHRSLARRLAVIAFAAASLMRPSFARDVAWNDSVDAKGCDGNWYQVQRARDMRRCLENGGALHCSPEEMQHRCWQVFGRQQNGAGSQPGPY